MRDGVKLAVDIIRPSRDSMPAEDPLPVVWSQQRYHRAGLRDGRVVSVVDNSPSLQTLVRHGYVVVSVDSRGSGASYGSDGGMYSPTHARDAYEMTEWLASQSWCDGHVGMFGQSYMGITQYMVASMVPPHLKAIFPAMAAFDNYGALHPGGIYLEGVLTPFIQNVRRLDLEVPTPTVDEDEDGTMLAEARAEHRDNWDGVREFPRLKYRDVMRTSPFGSPADHLQAINRSEIPAYHWGGWFDVYTREEFLWYVNFDNPQKMAIGPWPHALGRTIDPDEREALLGTEQRRWFDYWLKGIDNGVMDEPPIHYVTMTEHDAWTWHASESWPPANLEEVRYFFSKGASGSIASVNDGVLATSAPRGDFGQDIYDVDYSASMGLETRWGAAMPYTDRSVSDAKGLTYTTSPLSEAVTVTGHPVVTLHVTSSAEDGDFFVYLEEVDKQGVSHYVTEGMLRASHRAVTDPPYNNLGLPYHRSYEQDMIPLLSMEGAEPVQLTFDMVPTSNVFNSGHRIRVTITCSDKGMMGTPELVPPPVVTIYRSERYASGITLPVAH